VTKITGGFGAVVIAPTALATSFENLTEDYYTYKIEVTITMVTLNITK
jgi:hypothetical protein